MVSLWLHLHATLYLFIHTQGWCYAAGGLRILQLKLEENCS